MGWAAGTCGVLGTEEGRGDACTPPRASVRGWARACVWAVGRGRAAVWVDWF